MAYTKQTFATGDVFTAANANHIEDGIESVDRALATKVDAVTGKGLSTNDYTDAEKEKLAGLSAGGGKPMAGATVSEAGAAGLVPAPAAGDQLKYLRGDGTWNNLETIIYSLYPFDIASGDSLEGVHTPGAIMANSVPYKEITVTLESGEGISYDDFSLQFKRRSGTGNHFYYSTYRTITLNFLEILGEPYDGTGWISFNMLNGSVTIVGKNKTIAIEPQVQFRDSYIFGDKAGTIRVYYLRDLQHIVTDYGTRITALENAST